MNRIAEDGTSYRKGLVLGFTMAEIMLLLVFCLIIVLAALLAQGRKQLDLAKAQIAELTLKAEGNETLSADLQSIRRLQDLARAGSGVSSQKAIDDTWERLVADSGLVSRLEQAGADRTALAQSADFVADVLPLAESHSAQDVLGSVASAQSVARQTAALQSAEAELAAARSARPGKRVDLPPIITLREDRGFYFQTGRAVLSAAFTARLTTETGPDLAKLIDDYDVDVIEVIGHTDERPIAKKASNLDESLLDAVRGGPIDALVPADNAGLGLARAVAVSQVLASDPRLAGIDILPLSAAQLIDTDGHLSTGGGGDVQERRRIEIRLRRSLSAEEQTAFTP